MTNAPEDVQLIYYHGPAGLVTERRVKLHALDVQGRTVERVEAGQGGQRWPGAVYEFPKWSPLLLIPLAALLYGLVDRLNWPGWTVYALLFLLLVGLIVLLNLRTHQAEKRFVQGFDVVTVRLDGPYNPERAPTEWPTIHVYAGQPIPDIPNETVNLIIHDLTPADRWRLVRGWQSYFSMTEEARTQVRARARVRTNKRGGVA